VNIRKSSHRLQNLHSSVRFPTGASLDYNDSRAATWGARSALESSWDEILRCIMRLVHLPVSCGMPWEPADTSSCCFAIAPVARESVLV
jgi:hypothetical protein